MRPRGTEGCGAVKKVATLGIPAGRVVAWAQLNSGEGGEIPQLNGERGRG